MEISKIGVNTISNIVANNKNNTTKPLAFGKSEDKIEISTKPQKASTAKKWGVGIASGMLTGLGQLINGETGKGFAFFGTAVGFGLISRVGGHNNSPRLATAGVIGVLATGVCSIVDAVKHAKSE